MEVPKSNVVSMQPQAGAPSETMLMLAAAEMHKQGRLDTSQPATPPDTAFSKAVQEMPPSSNIEDRRGDRHQPKFNDKEYREEQWLKGIDKRGEEFDKWLKEFRKRIPYREQWDSEGKPASEPMS